MSSVNDIEFWEERIKRALSRGLLHHSIYEADPVLWEAMETRHMAMIHEHLEPHYKVLDIACGYGRYAPNFDHLNYTGVDMQPTFIKFAEEANPDHNFVQGDIRSLPFEDNEFDVGFGVSIKAMIQRELGEDEWEIMETELKRVCKKLLFLEYSDGRGNHLVENMEVIN